MEGSGVGNAGRRRAYMRPSEPSSEGESEESEGVMLEGDDADDECHLAQGVQYADGQVLAHFVRAGAR